MGKKYPEFVQKLINTNLFSEIHFVFPKIVLRECNTLVPHTKHESQIMLRCEKSLCYKRSLKMLFTNPSDIATRSQEGQIFRQFFCEKKKFVGVTVVVKKYIKACLSIGILKNIEHIIFGYFCPQ